MYMRYVCEWIYGRRRRRDIVLFVNSCSWLPPFRLQSLGLPNWQRNRPNDCVIASIALRLFFFSFSVALHAFGCCSVRGLNIFSESRVFPGHLSHFYCVKCIAFMINTVSGKNFKLSVEYFRAIQSQSNLKHCTNYTINIIVLCLRSSIKYAQFYNL